jgi:hypothetical protein
MPGHAIFLNGPLGVGKSTLGRALAMSLDGAFLDGDDCADPGRPWYASSLRTSRAILRAGLSVVAHRPAVVIAYPLRCSSWIFFRAKFADAGVHPLFVGLSSSYEEITGANRGRRFTADERSRIKVMIEEGYGRQPFNDVVVETGRLSFGVAVQRLASAVLPLLVS